MSTNAPIEVGTKRPFPSSFPLTSLHLRIGNYAASVKAKAGEDCRTLHATSRCTLALPLPKAAQGHPRQKETKRDKRKQRSHKMWNLL